PYQDDYCLFGCDQSFWVMRGDPGTGSSIDQLSSTVGLFSAQAWCFDDKGNLYFVDPNGIYAMGVQSQPVSLTEKTIPNFNKDFKLDVELHRVCLEYDKIRHGILITKTDVTTGANENYWLDLRAQGLFPEIYPDSLSIFTQHYYESTDSAYRVLMVGCKDGYIRTFDEAIKMDDVEAGAVSISSEMVIGPIPLSRTGDFEVLLESMSIVPADDGDSVDYQIFAGNTAEQVLKAAKVAVPSARINGRIFNKHRALRPRARGAWLAIRFYNPRANESWALEQLSGELAMLGKVGT
ncbi:MAG: hypothetical protein Q7T18_12640, partial [Sedimentisphaerales bacterium]|nr:hypothetical protein [Sedimentisphaerales bacterium]